MNQVWIVFDRSGEVVGVLDSEEKAKAAVAKSENTFNVDPRKGDFYECHEVK